jgi:hypothetical protein
MLRIYHGLAVFAFSLQAQRNWLSFAAECRRELESQYDASSHSADCQHHIFTNEFWELTEFWCGRTMPSPGPATADFGKGDRTEPP